MGREQPGERSCAWTFSPRPATKGGMGAVAPTPVFGLLLMLSGAPTQVQAGEVLQAEVAADPVEEAEVLARRSDLASIHRVLGVATFVSMVATVWLGDLHYYDRYGFFATHGETPCAEGDAVLGFCGNDTPWPHLIGALTTTALYVTTASLAFAMPDVPEGMDEDDSEYGEDLRQHRTLRWVHLVGMALQAVLGPLIANPELLGLDREQNHRLLQGLATAHGLIGIATATALGWAAWVMLF